MMRSLIIAIALMSLTVSCASGQGTEQIMSYEVAGGSTLTISCDIGQADVQWAVEIFGREKILTGGRSETGKFSVKIPDIAGKTVVFWAGTQEEPAIYAQQVIKV